MPIKTTHQGRRRHLKEHNISSCGYIKIEDDIFTYLFSDYKVTLLPAHETDEGRQEIYKRIRQNKDINPKFYFGLEGQRKIAFLCNGKISTDLLGIDQKVIFFTPLMVRSTGNTDSFFRDLSLEWSQFHAITFYGGNVNSVINPQIAVEKKESVQIPINGEREIKLCPWTDYTRDIEVIIDDEKATLTISVVHDAESYDRDQMGAYSLGVLNSFIRLSFETAQGFEKIEKYYVVIYKLLALLTGRRNLHFNMFLSQRNSEKELQETALCAVYEPFENFSNREWHQVISIYDVFDCLPNIIQKIAKNETDIILDLLPDNNEKEGYITISNVQDLCTALEVAYKWSDKHSVKDKLIEDLKGCITETIHNFMNSRGSIDVYKETTISSAFQYLDYTLKQRVLELYVENQKLVDFIVRKWKLPEVNEASIGEFVKLRNKKTHSGVVNWGENAKIYTPLLSLVYIGFFRHIKLTEDNIVQIIRHFF